LATKSLTPVVDPSLLVQDSEYLETHLVVVPASSKREFLKSYETLSPMVVPRSSVEITHDEEFVLFAVATFKKHSAEFVTKCREQKWTPRQYKHVEGGREEEQRELDRVTNEERKVCGEALRIGRTAWSESVMIWAHVLTLRVFVEAVLRYGFPLEYVTALVKVDTLTPPLPSSLCTKVLNLQLLTRVISRPPPSWLPRSRRLWIQNTHTWAATPSGGTSAARLPRTTRH
jgi:V-type H+-transporting ATPase subunit C